MRSFLHYSLPPLGKKTDDNSDNFIQRGYIPAGLLFVLFSTVVTSDISIAADALNIEIDTGIDSNFPLKEDFYQAFYNNIDASAFLRLRQGRIYFEVPYPAREDTFSLRIITKDDNATILSANFSIENGVPSRQPDSVNQQGDTNLKANTEQVTDSQEPDSLTSSLQETDPQANTDTGGELDFSYHGQVDLSALATSEDGSEFERRESEQQRESDILSGVSLGFNYKSLETSLNVEGVHRSNQDSTLRFDGPRADISQLVSTLRFNTSDGSAFYLNAGDVNISSKNTLVNSGMSSRGFNIGYVAPNDRFFWEVGRVYGQDIVGMARGPLAISDNSYRIGASAGVKLVNQDQVEWSVRFSMLDVNRDIEDAFATGESQSGEVNTVRGIGTDLSLFDNSLNLSLSWAESEYDNPSELNDENVPDDDDFEVFSPGVTRGNAYRHSIQWDAWRNAENTRAVSLEYETERSEPFYRSIQGDATADRRQWSLFADITAGPIAARIGSTQYQNNLDNLISIHTLDEAVHTAEVTLDVVSWQETLVDSEEETSALVPSTVGLRASVEELKTLNGDVIILAPVIAGFDFMDQTTQTLGLSLAWEGESNSTTLDIDYVYFDNDQAERAEADTRDLVYTLSHSIFRDQWSLSGRVGLSLNDDLDTVSRSKTELTEYGLSGSYTTQQDLTFSVGLDRSVNKFNDRVQNDDEDSRSVSYNFSLDFGSWLAQRLQLRFDPSVTASWQRTTTDNRSIFFQNDQESQSLSINIGASF